MVPLEARLQDDLKAAMKAGDKVRLGTIRLARSQLQYAKIEAGERWSDEAALETLAAAAKMRRDSIEQFEKGNRKDLADRERAELAIIEAYLPRQLTAEEMDALIDETLTATGATAPKDLGKVMSVLMPKMRGRIDGKLVNAHVREKLGAP